MTKHTTILMCGTLACAWLTACSSGSASSDTPAAGTARPAAAARPTMNQTVAGTVLETINASSYTYVRVKTDAGELWAAAPQFKTAIGDALTISLEQPMENFHSQALNRDFARVYFVSQIDHGGDAVAPTLATSHGAVQGAGGARDAQTGTTPIKQPANGTTVETIWKTRASLEGKAVTVRGKVVKFNGGILGVNWIHLQDGTGKGDDGTNDITVTTDGAAKVGDVITITGTISLNKDLGSGYNYPVIIEHARIERQQEAR